MRTSFKVSNAAGPGLLFTTEVTKIGTEHNCAKCTGTPAKTSSELR